MVNVMCFIALFFNERIQIFPSNHIKITGRKEISLHFTVAKAKTLFLKSKYKEIKVQAEKKR